MTDEPTAHDNLPNKPTSTAIGKFFSNPIVGGIGWVATLVGVLLSIYFYFGARESRELVYYVNPIKAAIVRSGQASRLATTFDGKPIQTDITAAQIAIWNKGKIAVKRDDILQRIVLQTSNNEPILEATIRKNTRDVTGVSLDTSNAGAGSITINLNIFERNDGCIVQVIYAGGTATTFAMDGIVEGQGKIEKIGTNSLNQSDAGTDRTKPDFLFAFILIFFGIFFAATGTAFYFRRRARRTHHVKWVLVDFISLLMFIGGMAYTCLGIYELYWRSPGVPFDF